MNDKKSFLNDKTYQKAKELLGKKKAKDINKLNADMAEAGLPSDTTEAQKEAFKRGREYANRQK